ncbi:hypothetical protein FS837_009346 [Tulasnella sp. UAMH 9824]|nr:hypothetical protein FS837_009346 [Tulasnella sp. UAMH 9824]
MADRPIDLPVEILLCILDNIQTVTVGDVTHTRERDLASSALVCKLWNEVATECLWRELPSALCLLCLLGEMTYGEPDGWNYTTAINKPNADRFRHLATRVLRLSHSNATRWKMAESSRINIEAIQAAFSWFSLQTHCDTLLPRVKTISWAAHDSYPSSQLPYFISSCLQSLSFTRISFWLYENPRGELERGIDIFTSLIKKQCQLKHLVFGIPWSLFDSSALKATYLEFASTQTRLRSIDIRDWIDESLVRSMVGASTTLVSLGCWVRGGEVGTFGRTIYALSTGFDVLRDLNLYVTGGEVTDEDFKQFMQLRSLRRITLSTLGFPRLEEADVEAMSRAWSDIEEFVVKQRGFVAANPHRLSILSAFARWMGSNLQILELDLDATAEPPPVAADSFKFVKLRELRIGQLSRAPPDPDEAVTEYLRSLSLGGQSSFKLVVGVSVFDAVDGWRKVRSSFERGNIGVEEAN